MANPTDDFLEPNENKPSDGLPTISVTPAGHRGAPRSAEYAFLLAPRQKDEIGRLGNYRVLRLLGQGGMGMVFHAEDTSLGRAVALKVMRTDKGRTSIAAERFLREARAMAAIKHDNLVTIYQVAQEAETIYIAMEYLQGESLESRLCSQKPWSLADIVRVGRELAAGLDAIHRHGMIHRDIKPANIWLETPNGRVKILDFGLARSAKDSGHLTDSNIIMGTPAYMSPEQVRGKSADAQSDLYSLGCVLYRICVGRNPFEADTTMAQLAAVIADDPVPVHTLNPALPRGLADLVMELLEKRPSDRPESAAEVADRLRPLKRSDSSGNDPVPIGATEVIDRAARPDTNPRPNFFATHWAKLLGLLVGAGMMGLLVFVGTIGILWYTQKPDGKDGPPGKKDAQPFAVGDPNKVYLKSLPFKGATSWPDVKLKGKLPKEVMDIPKSQGKLVPNSIFMHAAPPKDAPASVWYDLEKKYETLVVQVGISDSSKGSKTPMMFSVYGDDQRLWKSKEIERLEQTDEGRVSVKNVSILKIMVEGQGDVGGAHGLWVEPYLVKRKD